MSPFNVGILTSSDLGAQGKREDASGPLIKEMVTALGMNPAKYVIVPDDQHQIADTLQEWADSGEVDLILTTGGTGLGPRDVTPEATLSVIERQVPGIPEAMRLASMEKTPMGMISRQVAGAKGLMPDSQPARQPEGRPGMPGRHFSCTIPRPHPAQGRHGSLSRLRPSP